NSSGLRTRSASPAISSQSDEPSGPKSTGFSKIVSPISDYRGSPDPKMDVLSVHNPDAAKRTGQGYVHRVPARGVHGCTDRQRLRCATIGLSNQPSELIEIFNQNCGLN